MRTEDLAGDAAGVFAALYVRYSDQVYHHVRKIVGNDADAADVTRTVFVKARADLSHGDRLPASIRAWVFAIAEQEAVGRQRPYRRRNSDSPPDSPAATFTSRGIQPPLAAVIPTEAVSAERLPRRAETPRVAPQSSEAGEPPATSATAPEAAASSGPERLRPSDDRSAQQPVLPSPPRIAKADALPLALAGMIAVSLIVFMVWNAGREQQAIGAVDTDQRLAWTVAVQSAPPAVMASEQGVRPPPQVPGEVQASTAGILISSEGGISAANSAQNSSAADTALGAPAPTGPALPGPQPEAPQARIGAPAGFTGANLRAEPSQQGRSIDLLSNGTPIDVLPGAASADGFNWRQVRTRDGKEGWVVSTALLLGA